MKTSILIFIFVFLGQLLLGQKQETILSVVVSEDIKAGTSLMLKSNSDSVVISRYPPNTLLIDYIIKSADSVSMIVKIADAYLYQQIFFLDGVWNLLASNSWVEPSRIELKYIEKHNRNKYKLIDFETVGRMEGERLIPLSTQNKKN